MKNLKIFILFLLSIAIGFNHLAYSQTSVGTVNINGTDVELFYKIKSHVTTPPVVVTPPVITTPVTIGTNVGAKISSYRYEQDRGFIISFKINGSTPQEISWDGSKYYPFSVIYLPANNSGSYYLKTNGSIQKVTVNARSSAEAPTIEGQQDTGQTIELPSPQGEGAGGEVQYAQLNQTYESPVKAKLHFPSHNNDADAQMLVAKKDGNTFYSYNRQNGWRPQSSYYGNHPKETQHAVDAANYTIYFKNTGNKPIIVGLTSGDAYAFYNISGYLDKTDWHQYLSPGQEASHTHYIYDKENKSSLKGSWDGHSNNFYFTGPFYENGTVTTDEIKIKDLPNGLEIPENGTHEYTFYKNTDATKNISIRFVTAGINQNAKYTVTQKNGLDIAPAYTMVTCYNTTIWKIFNNNAEGYVDSPDYIKK